LCLVCTYQSCIKSFWSNFVFSLHISELY